MQRGEKTGDVRVPHEGFFGIKPTGAIGIWRAKIHVHIRRQLVVLGPHVQMLAFSLLPQKRNAASVLSFCLWHWVSVGKGVWGEQGVCAGCLGTLAQTFSCFSLSNQSRRKQAGKQSLISEGNWAPEIILSPCF